MRKLLHIALVMLLFIPAACAEEGQGGARDFDYSQVQTQTLVIKSGQGAQEHRFNVELARTPQEIMQGLMFRNNMPADHGMLFMFAAEAPRNFWMQNTYIPLDILYIRESGIIHHIHENAVPLDETPIPSQGPVLSVLELNGGTAARLGIVPGDIVFLSADGNSLAP